MKYNCHLEEGIRIMKKQPQRTCMGCNTKKDKKDLIRIVKNKENQISVDRTGKKEGRGEACSTICSIQGGTASR